MCQNFYSGHSTLFHPVKEPNIDVFMFQFLLCSNTVNAKNRFGAYIRSKACFKRERMGGGGGAYFREEFVVRTKSCPLICKYLVRS